MRFCPQCGAPLMAQAKFCVECGRSIAGAAAGAGEGAVGVRTTPITTAFVAVFAGITIVGLGAAAWIMLRTPEVVREQVASAPVVASAGVSTPASGNPPSGATTANPAPGGKSAGELPPGHPKIELPTEARTFIDKIEKEARAKPSDVAAWNKLGAVSMRAAMFDSSYYAKAEEAYAHVLKLQPENLDALRGIGDIDYDKQHYDEAVAAYEHYLKIKSNDPEVRTDLGTMYLYTGNADQAIVQYKKAIASKPEFFQAYYNMGIAYAQQNKTADARASLEKALKLAADDTARNQVKELIAKLNSTAGSGASGQPALTTSSTAAEERPAEATPPIATASAKDFHGAIEQMVRGLPIAGAKVGAVQWPDKLKAKVMMDNFPMDQMPPFAKSKFLGDLKAGIETAKKQSQVSSSVEVDIVDGASGKVMETITQ
ncbi:MAG: tetratricopeptide repeat protein [Candidatus Binatus sp.]|uniref:tetratricopeptide repeat protein n=1 Tax=Candidatus Binatus sp. TaxID=2811406 RepID=UPI00271A2A9B|nr:tetratricopeptide repeat protein [Candidatus Binatus sp.]MDO8432127.1 tetratricopeptide repeat protein [Candidatus Binatus sp.]